MSRFILFCLVFFSSFFGACQSSLRTIESESISQPPIVYPTDYFRFPLNIAPSLAADFGDLRSNHYHMGLDLRTQQRENLAVVAAADGYVSHIRIEPYGYGRVIFITHPAGYTTLYAHLNTFFPELEAFVHRQQYATESWTQDIDLSPAQFPVKKNQFIAWSGNTGGSAGPHLHFEIRDSGLENGHNRNPLLFGLNIPDHTPPTLSRLAVFDRSQSIYESASRVFSLQKKTVNGESFYTPAAVVKVPYGKFCFGLDMQDKTDNSFSLGVYKTVLYVDDSLRNSFKMEECLYDDSRYINAGIDYFAKYNGGNYMQLLSRLPGNKAPFFDSHAGNGVLQLEDDSIHNVEVEALDVAGNTSRLRFNIQRDKNLSFAHNEMPGAAVETITPNKSFSFKNESVEIQLGANAVYDTLLLRYDISPAPKDAVSDLHSIGDYRLPVHSAYEVRIKPTALLTDNLKKKTVMIKQSGNNKDAQTCTWQGDWAMAKWRSFGKFYLQTDNIPPSVKPVNVKDKAVFVKDQKLVFDAKDDLGDLQSFNGYIDGRWVIFKQKDDRYTYNFDERCPPGEHTLLVKAIDLAGNETVYQCSFVNGAKK